MSVATTSKDSETESGITAVGKETITDEDKKKEEVGFLQYFTLLRTYLRDRCVHEILVDNNKEKAVAQEKSSISKEQKDPLVILNEKSVSNDSDDSGVNEPKENKEEKNMLKSIVLNTPGVDSLSSQLCFKIQSDQSAAAVAVEVVEAATTVIVTTGESAGIHSSGSNNNTSTGNIDHSSK